MKKSNKKAVFHTTEVVTLIILTCIIGIGMGFFLGNRADYPLPSNTTDDEHVANFLENYQYVIENFYGEIDSKTLMDGALNGMLASLKDDYSTVISSNTFDAQLEGNYQGVGIEIYSDEKSITILNVFEGSSAAEAGLKPGDVIVSIDGVNYLGKESSTITDYIKNSKATSFQFEILREGQMYTFILKRGKVTIPSIESKVFDRNGKKIGYIYIDIFASATVSQFSKALNDLESKNIDGLILDVRNNSGGHLTTVVDILSNFMDKTNVIYQTETKTETKKFYSKGKVNKTYPIAVLQNNSSASASELLSVALQEQYGATVIGETSYGKGTVQELVTMGDTEYKFTTKKWLSPKGNWIHEKGVAPNISITLDANYYDNPSDENDNQLQAAINELVK